MKKVLLLTIIFLLNISLFAQVRSKVCFIRPNYDESVTSTLAEIQPYLDKIGVYDSYKYINDFIEKGNSGSGFVYVTKDGRNFVITNYHVIRNVQTVTAIFQDEQTNKPLSFSNLKIYAASEEIDVAILEFDNNEKPFSNGLEFFNDTLNDGDTIYTAGFPNLWGKAEWQFGTGIITNKNVNIPELIKPELSHIIQHSGAIAGGNSGGPLLIQSSENDYKVVGINTWTLSSRTDTNFAVPSQTIQDFLNHALNDKSYRLSDDAERIKEKSQALHKLLNHNKVSFSELERFISMDYVTREGSTILNSVINNCSTDDRKTIKNKFLNNAPLEGLKYAIAWEIVNEYHRYEDITKRFSKDYTEKEDSLQIPDTPAKINNSDLWYSKLLNGNSKRFGFVEWTFSNGSWQFSSFANLKNKDIESRIANNEQTEKPISTKEKETKTKSKKPVKPVAKKYAKPYKIPEGEGFKIGKRDFYNPYHFAIGYGMSLSLTEWQHTLDIDIKVTDWISLNLSTDLAERRYNVYFDGRKELNIANISQYAGLQFQLPEPRTYVVTMPYLCLEGGAIFADFSNLDVYPAFKGKLGYRWYFKLPTDKMALFVDINLGIKLRFIDFKVEYVYPTLLAGIAF